MITEAQVFLTRKCNLNCGYCKLTKNKKIKDLSLEDWEKSFLKLEKIGIKTVKIMGGEPTVKNWLPDLIEFISKNTSIKVAVLSNSVFSYQTAEKLAKSGLFGYYASIDSLQDIYEGGDPVKKTHNGYSMLQSMKNLGVPLLGANVVINKFNMHLVPSIVKELSNRGIYVNVCTLQVTKNKDKEFSRSDIKESYKFKSFDLYELIDISRELIEIKKGGYKITVPYEYLKNISLYGINSNWQCKDIYQLRIDSDGGLMLCNEYRTKLADKYKIQNITLKEYEEFLREWKNQRKKVNCDGCYWSCFIQAKNNIENNQEEFHFFS